jgi:adenylate kinase family enzyme
MINGWILTGFPKNSSQLNFLLESNNSLFKPSLIVIMDLDDEYVTRRSNYRRIDPTTGKVYYIDAPDFGKNHPEITKRLVFKNEDKPEIFQKRLENFKKIPNFPENLDNIILRLDGEAGLGNMIERISDAMENATT